MLKTNNEVGGGRMGPDPEIPGLITQSPPPPQGTPTYKASKVIVMIKMYTSMEKPTARY